jgi:hypothetical protein
MSRTVVIDPVVSRTGSPDKIATPSPVKASAQIFDPVCRKIDGDQTIIPDVVGSV